MAPSFSRVSSGALLLTLAYSARPVKADFWEDVANCNLVLNDLPADLTTDFCHDWTYGQKPEKKYVTITGYPVTVTEYPDAKTCSGEGTSTKYPESTPEPSKSYESSVPTDYSKPASVTSSVPYGWTTAPPDYTSAYGGAVVTVTSTITTTYWVTSTIYEGYPTATPAPYRRQLEQRATWCIDRPCRLVQYDDQTIFEACKKYLGWKAETKTVNVPGKTVTVVSYPTNCQKKDEGYKPEPKPEPYPTKGSYQPEYDAKPSPAPYPEDKPVYNDGGHHESYPEDDSYSKEPESSFDNNYSGPDGPKPWDDAGQTSELADLIAAGGYDWASKETGLDNAPWNAQYVDFPQRAKRDYPKGDESYSEDHSKDGKPDVEHHDSYDIFWVDDKSYKPEGSYKPEESYKPEDSYKSEEKNEGSYPEEYAPNIFGPDVPEGEDSYKPEKPSKDSYHDDGSKDHPAYPWGSPDDKYDDKGGKWSLPDSSEYEGDEFESDYDAPSEAPSWGPPSYDSSWSEDGVDY